MLSSSEPSRNCVQCANADLRTVSTGLSARMCAATSALVLRGLGRRSRGMFVSLRLHFFLGHGWRPGAATRRCEAEDRSEKCEYDHAGHRYFQFQEGWDISLIGP